MVSCPFLLPRKVAQPPRKLAGSWRKVPRRRRKLIAGPRKIPQRPRNLIQLPRKLPQPPQKLIEAPRKLPRSSRKVPQSLDKVPQAPRNLISSSRKLPQLRRRRRPPVREERPFPARCGSAWPQPGILNAPRPVGRPGTESRPSPPARVHSRGGRRHREAVRLAPLPRWARVALRLSESLSGLLPSSSRRLPRFGMGRIFQLRLHRPSGCCHPRARAGNGPKISLPAA